MKKAKKLKMISILSLVLAFILCAISGYILLDNFLRTRTIDFTWTTNILLGIGGVLILTANHLWGKAKESKSLFD